MKTEASSSTRAPVPSPRTFEELRELCQRANDGDETVLPQVRQLVRQHPEAAIPALRGDVQAANRQVLIHRLSGGNRVRAEVVARHLEPLKKQLAGPQPTSIELILVDRILICWLQVQLGDRECFNAAHSPGTRAEHLEKIRDRAHRRFLSAVKMLATVRKLALPNLQVNIGEKQINTTG